MRIERGIYPNFGNYACLVRSRKLRQRQEEINYGSRNYITAQVTFQLVPGPRLLGTGPNHLSIQWVVKNRGFNQIEIFFPDVL